MSRSFGTKPAGGESGHQATGTGAAHHQDRVNHEMFKAIELLGRRLEKTESERDRLARRLEMIESAATLDEKTGRFYLPAVVDPAGVPQKFEQSVPKWTVATSLMSSAVALLALGLVIFTDPVMPQGQIAALGSTTFSSVSPQSADWKSLSDLASEEDTTDTVDTAVAERSRRVPRVTYPVKNTEEVKENLNSFVADNSDDSTVYDDVLTEQDITDQNNVDLAAVDMTDVEPAAGQDTQSEEKTAVSETDKTDKEESETVAETVDKQAEEKPVKEQSETVAKAETKPETKPVKDEPVVATAPEKPATDQKVTEPKPAPKTAQKDPQKTQTSTPSAALRRIGYADPIGVPVSVEPDAHLPEKLAELETRAFDGVAEAQHDLATLYASGKLVGQDYKRAAYWFYKSAEGGVANAHYNLGVMYHQGLGVETNLREAIAWYENAAELGHPEAMYNLGIAYIEGIGVEPEVDRGVSFFKRAANAGITQAAYNLGVLYESNFVGSIDEQAALEWYQLAARSGHADASEAVSRLTSDAVTLARNIEPAAGEALMGEGDASPINENVPDPDNYRRSLLLRLQEQLISRGFLKGSPDGRFDQKTRAAISSYQKAQDLPLDGLPSEELLQHMLRTPIKK